MEPKNDLFDTNRSPVNPAPRVRPANAFIEWKIEATASTVPHRFRQQARTHPDRTAVKIANYAVTYNTVGEIAVRSRYKRYAEAIKNFGIFDAIIVDGAIRQQCARAARPQLSDEGLMILDNSDWLPATAKYLRGSGLIEMDLSGLKPGRDYSQTTSFFFSRGFNFQPGGRQPLAPVGGRIVEWETVPEGELEAASQ